jgi:transcriptional regulator with XRE-family HTH domain
VANDSFGEWLRRQRRASGWTQKELAFRVNCSTSAIRKMEAEERRPSAQVIERLAEVFEIPLSERKAFLRFARGGWRALLPQGDEAATLRVLRFDPRSPLPQSMMDFPGSVRVDDLLRLAWESPDVKEKLALLQHALAQAETQGDVRRQLEYLWQLGWLDQVNRFAYWEQALTHARILGDSQALASGLSMVGFFLVLNGDLDSAQKYLADSSMLHQQLQLKPVTSHLISAYGQISLIRGEFEKARAYLQEHARASLELGSREDYLWSYVRLGYVALHEGNLAEARAIFRESVQEFRKDKSTIGVVFALEGLARLYQQMGDAAQAARLIGWADSTREKISDMRPVLEQAEVDRIRAACLTALGELSFTEAYEEGKELSLDEAIASALSQD